MGSDQYPATVSRDAMAEHYAYLAEKQNKPKEPVEQNGLVEDFLRSAGHSAIQTPINAVVQLADKGLGTNMLPSVQIRGLEAPQVSEYGTGNYWAQQTGAAVGMLVPFLAVGKGVKSVTRAGMSEVQLAERLTQRTVLGLSMKEAVLTGAVHDSFLRPVDEHNTQPFLVAKALNGVNGAITMGVMHGVATRFSPVVGETSKFAPLIKNPYMGGLTSGIVAGGVSAHTHKYLGNLKFDSLSSFGSSATTDARFATWKETKESMVTMGVIGLGFGTYHGVKGQFESGRKNFDWQKSSNEVATAGGEKVNVQGKDFKVVGGERALTRALNTFDKTGEVSLAVREHIGAGKGFKRILGMQEYGPEQNLLVKHNTNGKPFVPESSKLADLIATCYLDPTMAGKSVLGAESLGENSAIFMRAGKNRLNFAPREQELRKGESKPRKLGIDEGYDPDRLAIRESESWTKNERAKLDEGEWTPEMVAKLQSVSQFLKTQGMESFQDGLSSSKLLSSLKVARELGQGNDAYVIELPPQKGLPDGGALKLAHNYEGGWQAEWGHRPFDAKILFEGKVWELSDSSGREVIAHVQELVDPRFDEALWPKFQAKLDKAGVQVRDPGQEGGFQYGRSRRTGDIRLTDYEATDVNPTLENLIAGRSSEAIAELELAREKAENAEPKYDNVVDLSSLRSKAEAYPQGSKEAAVLQELLAGSDAEMASYSIIAWKASQNNGVADWSKPAMSSALKEAKQIQKEAKAKGLLD